MSQWPLFIRQKSGKYSPNSQLYNAEFILLFFLDELEQLAKLYNRSHVTTHSARFRGFISDEQIKISALSQSCYFYVDEPTCIRFHWLKHYCFGLIDHTVHHHRLLIWHDISQGSVATHLRCGGIFSDSIITRFLLILTVT